MECSTRGDAPDPFPPHDQEAHTNIAFQGGISGYPPFMTVHYLVLFVGCSTL